MSSCPVCSTPLSENICPGCGYDPSRDYGRFPTFGKLTAPAGVQRPVITAIAAAGSRCAMLFSDGTVRVCDRNSDLDWMEPNWEPVSALYPGRRQLCGKNRDGVMLCLPLDIPYSTDLSACAGNLRQLAFHGAKIRIDAPPRVSRILSPAEPYLEAAADGTSHTLCLRPDGSVLPICAPGHPACQTGRWSDVTAVAASPEHSFALTKSGTVLAAGDQRRKIVRVHTWKDIAAIAPGSDHIVGLRTDGTLCAAGSNHADQCLVQGWYDITAIAAGRAHTVGLRKNGSVIAIGDNSAEQCRVSHWHGIIAIAAGDDFTVGLTSGGTLVCTDGAMDARLRSCCP